MHPNTAICLLVVAGALALLAAGRAPRLTAGLSVAVMLVAGATLVEHAASVDLHIDRLIISVSTPGPAAARMSVMGALALLLLGTGCLAGVRNRGLVLQVMGLGAFAIGYVGLVGYGFDAHALYSFAGYRGFAVVTAMAIACAAAGLLVTRPDEGLVGLLTRSGSAGRLTRRVVPFLLVGAAGLGGLAIAADRHTLIEPRFGIALLTLMIAAVGMALVWRSAVLIDRAERAHEATADRLRRLTGQLRSQVSTLVATAPDAIVTVNPDGVIVAANPQAADMFGYDLSDLYGESVDRLLPTRLQALHAAHRRDYAATPRLRRMGVGLDLVARRADGSEFPVAVSLAPMPGEDGQVVLATVRDLTAARAVENAARESAHRFAAAFDDAPVGMILLDLDGRIRQVNQALALMLESERHALVGQDLLVLVDPRDVDDDAKQRAELLAGHIPSYQREMRLLTVDGEPVWTSISTALVRDAAGAPAHLVLHIEDIRSRKQFEGRLQYLADHDPLTGLFNRRRFEQELTRHLAEHARYGGNGAVLLLDLDNFKYVNDTLGHSAGDALIRAVAATLSHRIREADILARIGGDEFAVLTPAGNVEEANALADALLEAVRSGAVSDQGVVQSRTTASIGVALLADGERSMGSVLAAADLAMYAAKDEGRDRVVVYDPAGPHLARTQARFRWLERVRSALDNDLLTLQAQPIAEVATGEVTHVELLVRMREGEGLVPPDRFLYIAERHGLGPAVDRWVVGRAVAFAAAMPARGGLRVEVNLSADSLGDHELSGYIAELLERHHVPPARLVFEVTETAAIANIDTARAFVEQVTELGCGFALDDFGAGFGSFYYLKYLPFDYLKIDGEFIRQLAGSRTDQLIVGSIVAAAKGLGKQTIAEYVGDAETVALLQRLGVDYAQGYYVGRPADLSRFLTPRPRAPEAENANRGR